MRLYLPVLIISLIFSAKGSFSQVADSIPNSSFERWSGSEPLIWQTSNFSGLNPGAATKSTTSSLGTYSIKLKTQKLFFNPQPGVLPDTMPGAAFLGNPINDDAGVPFVLAPETFHMSYQYIPAGNDTGLVLVQLSKWDTIFQQRNIIAATLSEIAATGSTWTSLALLLNYSSLEAPDSLNIIIASSGLPQLGGPSAKIGSILYADDLYFTGNVLTSINNNNLSSNKINVSPNPSSDFVEFTIKDSEASVISVFDSKGSLIQSVSVTSKNVINVEKYSSGIYFYNIRNKNNSLLNTGKFIVK